MCVPSMVDGSIMCADGNVAGERSLPLRRRAGVSGSGFVPGGRRSGMGGSGSSNSRSARSLSSAAISPESVVVVRLPRLVPSERGVPTERGVLVVLEGPLLSGFLLFGMDF